MAKKNKPKQPKTCRKTAKNASPKNDTDNFGGYIPVIQEPLDHAYTCKIPDDLIEHILAEITQRPDVQTFITELYQQFMFNEITDEEAENLLAEFYETHILGS